MSIASEITRLQNAKSALKTSINAKTDSSHQIDDETLDEYSDFVDSIQTGGGGSTINIYSGSTEPETNKGLWIKSVNLENENLIFTDEIDITESWYSETLTNVSFDVLRTGSAKVGNYIYLMGGSASNFLNYKYNPVTQEMTQNTDIPFNFYRSCIVAIGTDIYLLGSGHVTGTLPKSNYKYDTLTDTYTQLANIPYNFYNGCAVSYENDIYLFGGTGGSTTAYKYNVASNTYTQLANIPTGFQYSSAIVRGGKIYLFGGNTQNASNYIYVYDIATNSYTSFGVSIPYHFYGGRVALVNSNIYLFGGANAPTNAYKLNLATKTFTQLTNIPRNFQEGESVLFDDSIYLFGGYNTLRLVSKLDLEYETFTANSIVVCQKDIKNNLYATELFDYDTLSGNILYYFIDFQYIDENGDLIQTEKYYGNGTTWVKL